MTKKQREALLAELDRLCRMRGDMALTKAKWKERRLSPTQEWVDGDRELKAAIAVIRRKLGQPAPDYP